MFLLLSSRLQRTVSRPILELAGIAQAISRNRDYSTRVEKFANDELGTLYDEFNAMLDEIQRNQRELLAGPRPARSPRPRAHPRTLLQLTYN